MKSKVLTILTATLIVANSSFVPENYPKVNLKFIYGSGEFNRSQYFMRDMTQLMSHRNFNPKLPSVLYISGWMQSPDAETTKLIVNGYLKRRDHNLLVLDWSDYSVGLFTSVMLRISKISRIFGRTMLKLFDKGLNIKTFHCLGHSFGAHSCGIIGRELIQVSNRKYKLGRITGLDAAGPGFYPASYEQPLNPDDADFVDSIHSDVFFVGAKLPVGHVDFYSNFNMVQPACPPVSFNSFFEFVNSMCSHFNAVRYWVDTLNPKYGKLFPCYECASWEDFAAKKCKNSSINYMGIEASRSKQGKFFVKLTSKHFYDGKAFFSWLLKRIDYRLSELLSLKF